MNVIGWGNIVPQLAAFFSVLKRRPNHYTPFNLFLSGKPGTNKTEGIEGLAQFLGLTAGIVDSSTLDDVSELAGVVDLRANRERGESRLIEGELLKTEILILDEFLNTRPHVLPQFRLLLQGKLVLMGKPVPMATRTIVATGNLSEEMQEGQANLLDSPTADRFAMVVTVPSLWEMEADERRAIAEGRIHQGFAEAFAKAIQGIDRQFELVEKELAAHVTSYLDSLGMALVGTAFGFEGRRMKLLRQFVIAALALCRTDQSRKVGDTVYVVVRDCLTYHRLSGLELDESILRNAHEASVEVFDNIGVEALVSNEPELAGKVGLVASHLSEVSAVTKADVFGHVVACGDVALQIAVQELVATPRFLGQPAELGAMVQRIQFPLPEDGLRLTPQKLAELSQLSQAEVSIFEICGGDREKMAELQDEARKHLASWGIAQR